MTIVKTIFIDKSTASLEHLNADGYFIVLRQRHAFYCTVKQLIDNEVLLFVV